MQVTQRWVILPILSTAKEAAKVILWSGRHLATQMQGQVQARTIPWIGHQMFGNVEDGRDGYTPSLWTDYGPLTQK